MKSVSTRLPISPLSQSAIIDESGNYLYVNNIFTQLFGYTLEDIPTEKDWFSLAFPDISEREEVECSYGKTISSHSVTGEVWPCVFPVRCKDGTVCQINFFRVYPSEW